MGDNSPGRTGTPNEWTIRPVIRAHEPQGRDDMTLQHMIPKGGNGKTWDDPYEDDLDPHIGVLYYITRMPKGKIILRNYDLNAGSH